MSGAGPDGDARVDRRVHYFHGFDPASVARYRRIFEASAARLGVETADTRAPGWRAVRDGRTVEVLHHRYEDLVRAWQGRPLWYRVVRGQAALAGYARDGALGQMARLGPRNLGLLLSPALFMAAIAGGALVAGAQWGWAGIAAALAGAVVLLALLVPRLYLHLVMDLFAYMRALATGRGPAHAAHTDRIGALADAVTDHAVETVVVGHSLGGIAAILALDAVLPRWPLGRPIGLLTLGSTHGTVLVQRGSGRDALAAAIGRIARDDRVFWVDVSSPRDAFCLPLVDPLCLIEAAPGMTSPRVISARLARAPRIPGDRRTVFAAMRRHMGYLLAPVDGSGFDYAEIITGAGTLAERFGPRRNSPKARMWHG